jgi:hypothetical protein
MAKIINIQSIALIKNGFPYGEWRVFKAMPPTMKSASKKAISIWVTSLGLGDTICSTPIIRKIRQMYKDAVIAVIQEEKKMR